MHSFEISPVNSQILSIMPLSIYSDFKDPCLMQTNVMGFVNLLECCRKYQVKKVIYISSGGAIYGEAKSIQPQKTIVLHP